MSISRQLTTNTSLIQAVSPVSESERRFVQGLRTLQFTSWTGITSASSGVTCGSKSTGTIAVLRSHSAAKVWYIVCFRNLCHTSVTFKSSTAEKVVPCKNRSDLSHRDSLDCVRAANGGLNVPVLMSTLAVIDCYRLLSFTSTRCWIS